MTILCLFLAWIKRKNLFRALRALRPTREQMIFLLIGLALAILIGALNWPKLVLENLTADGTEIFVPARDLQTHFLPRWDLETQPRFGLPGLVPFWAFHYLLFPWVLLMGGTEAAIRLPILLDAALFFGVAAALFRGRKRKLEPALLLYLIAGLLFSTSLLIHCGGYDPYMTEAAEGKNFFFLGLLLLMGLYCLQTQNGWLLLISVAASIFTRWWTASLWLFLFAAAWIQQAAPRRWLARWGAAIGLSAVLIAAGGAWIAVQGDYLSCWTTEIGQAYGPALRFPWADPIGFSRSVLQWVFLAGILPALSLIKIKELPAIGRALIGICLGYLVLLGLIHPERTFYEQALWGLLVLALGGIWISGMQPKQQRVFGLFCAGIFLVSTYLVFPKPIQISTLNRQLGERTGMLFDSYEEALRHARIADEFLEQGAAGWEPGYPAWVHYSTLDRHPQKKFSYYLSDQEKAPVAGAVLLARSSEGSYFYAAGHEAARALRDWNPRPRHRLKWLRDEG